MKKILLIEDNDDVRNNTAEILELSNYEVLLAENGKIGIEKALKYKPDLIICDIMMPVLDGYGVLHAVQKNDVIKNTPFIFLSAKTERGDLRKGMELGADDYVTKPFEGTELLNAIDGRLKKYDLLKQDLGLDADRLTNLLPSEKFSLLSILDNRDINKYQKKQIIYWEGNHPNKLFYILKGKVKTYKIHPDGKTLVTDLFCPGDFLGHIALMEGTTYKDTAETIEETELVEIPKEIFDNLIIEHSEIAGSFVRLMAKNISEKEAQLLGFAYNSLRKKVAEALLIVHKKYPDQDDNASIKIGRENLATIAGTAKESLSRTLSDFCSENLIDIKDGNITILNQKKLERMPS